MTESVDSAHALKLEAMVSEDKRNVDLRFMAGENVLWQITADTKTIEHFISSLGMSRRAMLDPIPNELSGFIPLDEYDPRWFVLPDSTNSFATFWIRHPGLGWSGYGFPRHEANNIAKWLRKIVPIASTKDAQSAAATSVGGDTFLLTTEGLGFYYYGKGEKRIGPNPFEQIEFDSDRAAGIVAGSIAENRLEYALRSRLREDVPTVADFLFQPSGPLGAFRNKIDLAYLMRVISDEAYKDLTNIKNIRNDFAHHLEWDSFDSPSVRDRCKNFILVDRHVGPVPPLDHSAPPSLPGGPDPYFGLPDYEQKLADPRFRYTMTAQIISYLLGQGSEKPDTPLPLI
jgi:hypothetical protein